MTLQSTIGIMIGIALGIAAGVGGYTFLYAKGASYLTNDPAACANCHVMNEQYAGWVKSSHRSVAVCNDCHAPHDLIGKYMTKAENGFRHSLAFTTGRFHEPIQITPHDREITEHACRDCHQDIVLAIDGPHEDAESLSCIKCHPSVGHMH
jgi:cytochrome c nitrite reductase small subunit